MAAALAVLLVALACSPGTVARLMVRNETTVPIAVHADGEWLGTVGPGAQADLGFALRDGPTEVTATTPTGAVVADLLGTRAMYDAAVAGTAPMSTWQDLPCGRVVLAVGPFDPSALEPWSVPAGPCP